MTFYLTNKLIANPLLVFREEFDDWGLLFDPDTGDTFGLNPIGVSIWKRLDGNRTVAEIALELKRICRDAPPDTEEYVLSFIRDLAEKGFAGNEFKTE